MPATVACVTRAGAPLSAARRRAGGSAVIDACVDVCEAVPAVPTPKRVEDGGGALEACAVVDDADCDNVAAMAEEERQRHFESKGAPPPPHTCKAGCYLGSVAAPDACACRY
jgi:hypothetical protein